MTPPKRSFSIINNKRQALFQIMRGFLVVLLLLNDLGARTGCSAAATAATATATAASAATAAAAATPRVLGAAGGGGREEEEEEEDLGSLVDRSAQIIREQDAEEGKRWMEESSWSPQVTDNTNDNDNDNDNNNTLCQKPTPPQNGYISGDDCSDGDVVHVHCENGYTLRGPDKLTCVPVPYPGAPGVWLPQDEYYCLPSLPTVIEIRALGSSSHEARPTYTILNGRLHGDNTGREPESDENARQPSLGSVTCPKPTAPSHGSLQGTDYSLYATVRVTCDEGYFLIGPDRITCLPVPDPFHRAGVWEPLRVPKCHAPPPSTLPLILMQELTLSGLSRRQHRDPKRRTDTLPNATRLEGLPSLCSLPKVVGPCRAAIPRFYFDAVRMECRPFIYGGCDANDNNFETFSDCQRACR
ncbi:uncharacterized protein LOC143284177 isoform X3 [Babylonia areolata]|uniref:uncharacterized protein LOC143284177 isoform X2 n=1 Tax=Babylonia areolata TaxID=304850 RepID=UPI003FCF83CA